MKVKEKTTEVFKKTWMNEWWISWRSFFGAVSGQIPNEKKMLPHTRELSSNWFVQLSPLLNLKDTLRMASQVVMLVVMRIKSIKKYIYFYHSEQKMHKNKKWQDRNVSGIAIESKNAIGGKLANVSFDKDSFFFPDVSQERSGNIKSRDKGARLNPTVQTKNGQRLLGDNVPTRAPEPTQPTRRNGCNEAPLQEERRSNPYSWN